MRLTPRQYAKTLFEALQETAPKDHDKVLDNFAGALALNNDIRMFEDIALEYERLEKESKGIRLAEVTSARPLDAESEREIVKRLNGMANAGVEIRKKVDEKILGGVVIRLDDTLIDASVKGSLEKLRDEIAE